MDTLEREEKLAALYEKYPRFKDIIEKGSALRRWLYLLTEAYKDDELAEALCEGDEGMESFWALYNKTISALGFLATYEREEARMQILSGMYR